MFKWLKFYFIWLSSGQVKNLSNASLIIKQCSVTVTFQSRTCNLQVFSKLKMNRHPITFGWKKRPHKWRWPSKKWSNDTSSSCAMSNHKLGIHVAIIFDPLWRHFCFDRFWLINDSLNVFKKLQQIIMKGNLKRRRCLFLSLSLTHTHTISLSLFLSLSLTHTHTIYLPLFLSLTLLPFLSLTHFFLSLLSLSLSLSHTHTHIFSLLFLLVGSF